VTDFNLSRFVGVLVARHDDEIRYILKACMDELKARKNAKGPPVHYMPPDEFLDAFTERTGDRRTWSACGVQLASPPERTWGGNLPERLTKALRSADASRVTCKRCRRSSIWRQSDTDLPF